MFMDDQLNGRQKDTVETCCVRGLKPGPTGVAVSTTRGNEVLGAWGEK
jgi:hypothetical protein